jgi:hypothetical protein
MNKLKIINSILLCFTVFWIASCESIKTSEAGDYTLVRDDLYTNERGDLFFKCVDRYVDGIEGKEADRYLSHVYTEDFSDNVTPMKEVIDAATFRSIGNGFYKDKNHIYKFNQMIDGGTFSVEGKPNRPTKRSS